ncbi:mitochondrial carrier protein [Rhizoctonia solani]|uniref:Mitochondrial carrier protein n=1 Tax=Rhizoctonia solani TaxID=456999 RepID=A0A8H8NL08_9AGAM|nr:mitochondrial carrier protein [Rhizoctonia solani]QRW15679.1 mitochondrial carrier protein [Rhizoctonia solani]
MATQSAAQHLISGAMSGLASSVVLQPLDLVKTQLQRGGNGKGIAGILGIAKNTVDKKGITGLWRGLTPTVARSVPGVAIYFYALQSVRGRLVKFPSLAAPSSTANEKGSALPKLRPEANLASGACTRVAVGFLLSPLAVLKESGAFEYTSIPQGLRSLVQTSGIRGLWQGFLPSVFRDAPYAGLFVASYEAAKNHGEKLFDTSVPSTAAVVHSGAGMFAGSFATFMTHPLTWSSMQVRSEPEFNSFRGTFSAILRESGLLGFYSGMSLRMTRKMCSSAIGWTVYEGMLLAFKKRDELLRQRERHESVTTITA